MPKAEPALRGAERIRESRNTRRNMFKAAGAALLSAPAAHDMRFLTPNLVTGNGQMPAIAPGAAANDPCFAIAQRWFAGFEEYNVVWCRFDAEADRLTALLGSGRFQKEWTEDNPLFRVLMELDARMAALWDERERLAEALTANPAQSFAGVAAKVAVARELIEPDQDDGCARPLLARALSDLGGGSGLL